MCSVSDGGCVWLIADAYFPKDGNTEIPSHEAVCILNTDNCDANILFNFYFEDDRPTIKNIPAKVPAEKCVHFRLDKPEQIGGIHIPYDTPYGIKVISDRKVFVQYSRAYTGSIPMSIMTTMAYCLE